MITTRPHMVSSWFGFGNDKPCSYGHYETVKCDRCGISEEYFIGIYCGNISSRWIVVYRPKGKVSHYCCDECREKGKRKR